MTSSHNKTRPRTGSLPVRPVTVQPANAAVQVGVAQAGTGQAVAGQTQPATTDELLVKTKRDELASRWSHQPANIGPPLVKLAGDALDKAYRDACVDELAMGRPGPVEALIDYLRSQRSKIPWDHRIAAARSCIESIFANPEALKELYGNPKLFAVLTMVANDVQPPSWLAGKVGAFPLGPELALAVIDGCWKDFAAPLQLDPGLRDWLIASVDVKVLNERSSGRACRLLNMLWNAKAYNAIKGLIQREIDIMQPATATFDGGPGYEGVYSGFVQPLGHVLAEDVWRVYLKKQNGLPPLKDKTQETARDEQIDRIAEMLTIVSSWPEAKRPFLTTYEEVLKSSLALNFASMAGTIWGFENIRMPFVHAVRGTVQPQPLRMMELWETIRIALGKGAYAELLAHPDTAITSLIELGVKQFRANVAEHPSKFADYGDIDKFIEQFETQCRSFLEALSQPTRLPKFATAAVGGQDYTKHLGSFGCQAGLHWAQKNGTPVYYCIDGVDFKDVTEYKRFKTRAINAYLHNGKPAYTDAITLAELREILRHWDELGKTVVFVEKGEVIKDAENKVKQWRADLFKDEGKDADGRKPKVPVAGTEDRFAPTRAALQDIIDTYIKPLGLPEAHVNGIGERDIMRVASAVDMLRMVANAKDPSVVGLCLKYADVLVTHGILPEDFASGFQQLLNEQDSGQRSKLAAGLSWQLAEAGISDYLAKPLAEAVRRLTPPTPPKPVKI